MDIIVKRGGRTRITKYNDAIRELRIKGFGSVRIQNELYDRGIKLSRMTINARLHEIDEELQTEGYTIIFK
jgi:hypothetical protein